MNSIELNCKKGLSLTLISCTIIFIYILVKKFVNLNKWTALKAFSSAKKLYILLSDCLVFFSLIFESFSWSRLFSLCVVFRILSSFTVVFQFMTKTIIRPVTVASSKAVTVE